MNSANSGNQLELLSSVLLVMGRELGVSYSLTHSHPPTVRESITMTCIFLPLESFQILQRQRSWGNFICGSVANNGRQPLILQPAQCPVWNTVKQQLPQHTMQNGWMDGWMDWSVDMKHFSLHSCPITIQDGELCINY